MPENKSARNKKISSNVSKKNWHGHRIPNFVVDGITWRFKKQNHKPSIVSRDMLPKLLTASLSTIDYALSRLLNQLAI
jgi:hypothetical protein